MNQAAGAMMARLTAQRALLVLCAFSLAYVLFVTSTLQQSGYRFWMQEGRQEAFIGLTPGREGLSNTDVAIIVCFRDRDIHLKIFLNYMNSFLLLQNSSAQIYVVEQAGKDPFNRAKLFNVGYVEAKKDYNYTCFIFHDVDLIPQNGNLTYRCSSHPIHLSAAIDKFNYGLPYKTYFGGVSAMSEEQLLKVNGFPNTYWGWGGEDDDISARVKMRNYTIHRPPVMLAKYTMLRFTGNHVQGAKNKERFKKVRKAGANIDKDGLNSLNYTLVNKVNYKTHIWILAHLGKYTAPLVVKQPPQRKVNPKVSGKKRKTRETSTTLNNTIPTTPPKKMPEG